MDQEQLFTHYSGFSWANPSFAATLSQSPCCSLHKKSRRLFRLRPVKIQILRQLPQADSSLKKPKKKQKPMQQQTHNKSSHKNNLKQVQTLDHNIWDMSTSFFANNPPGPNELYEMLDTFAF
ncbi:MAG: hypothetical protein JRJ47_07415 [Deltaproteobacteria bacterium]|nr:hypothetical protein [Deltaproteobacteria bacterium]